jgi:hypothetical protein
MIEFMPKHLRVDLQIIDDAVPQKIMTIGRLRIKKKKIFRQSMYK